MKRFLTVLLIAGNLFFMPAASAEIKTYDGVGEYIMSDFETFDVAQQRAKQRAEQNACEQAGVYVESRTEVRNAQVTKDEIITMTSGILKIVDVQYKREILNDNTTRIRATVKANIDSDDINKWLEKSAQERATLVEKNEELRRANAEQNKQITELKQQLANVKTQQDKDRLRQAIIDVDGEFWPNLNERTFFSNFTELVRAVGFKPLYMSQERNYEIQTFSVNHGVAEIRYGRRWEPKVSLTVKTYKRSTEKNPQGISGVTGVKWRVDTSTSTTIYIAKISANQQVAEWAVGQYNFSVQTENFKYADFYSIVVDIFVPLSTHYYLD